MTNDQTTEQTPTEGEARCTFTPQKGERKILREMATWRTLKSGRPWTVAEIVGIAVSAYLSEWGKGELEQLARVRGAELDRDAVALREMLAEEEVARAAKGGAQ